MDFLVCVNASLVDEKTPPKTQFYSEAQTEQIY